MLLNSRAAHPLQASLSVGAPGKFVAGRTSAPDVDQAPATFMRSTSIEPTVLLP
jgi:hypothetical protein